MNPETGTFTSMDTYAGTLENPVSLHKYLYANANPVMYTDPSGYFSLAEMSVVQSIQSTINSVIVPYFNVKKIMSWANLAVTMYDVAQQVRLILAGEANILGLAFAIAKGMVTQALLNCALTAVLGEAATTVLKIVGIAQNADSFIEAVKSGDPERIIVESIRLAVSVYALKSQCFTGDTLVSTADGDRRIDEIEAGHYVWSYDTELDEKVFARVTNVSVTETDVLVHVITSEGDDIRTTMFHPFYVKSIVEENGSRYNGEWKAALNLIAGDELLVDDGRVIYVEEVRIERLAKNIKVYNLEIGDLHTYFVTSGVLVHNGCGENTTPSEVSQILDNRPELIGTNRDKLLTTVQDVELAKILNEVYRPGAKIGDGGTADVLKSEYYNGYSKHLQKAKERLGGVNILIASGRLGLNDLDIAEALRTDLENAIKLFER